MGAAGKKFWILKSCTSKIWKWLENELTSPKKYAPTPVIGKPAHPKIKNILTFHQNPKLQLLPLTLAGGAHYDRGVPSTTAADDTDDGCVKDTKVLTADEQHNDQNRKAGYLEGDKVGVHMRNQLGADAGVIDDIQNKMRRMQI